MGRRTPARWRTTAAKAGWCVRQLWRGPVHLATMETRSAGDNRWRVEVGSEQWHWQPAGNAKTMLAAEAAAKTEALKWEAS